LIQQLSLNSSRSSFWTLRARPQWSILAATKRFQFRFTLGRELARTLDEVPELAGFNHAAYERWREKRKLTDNLSLSLKR
jgi:hypothetical protein